MAMNPSVDVDKFERLIALQERQLEHEARMAFTEAMAKAQAEMEPVRRDATNSHTNSKYARLETIDLAIRPIYTRHGFSVSYNSADHQQGVEVIMTLRHARGHAEAYRLAGPLDGAGAQGKANKTGIQALGSSTSYLRRYLLCMAFNITLTNEDNDGNNRRAPRQDEGRLDHAARVATAEIAPDRSAAMAKFRADIMADLSGCEDQPTLAKIEHKFRKACERGFDTDCPDAADEIREAIHRAVRRIEMIDNRSGQL